MNMIDKLFIAASVIGCIWWLYGIWRSIYKKPKSATEKILDRWADMLAVSRMHYGADSEIKPNDHCYWVGEVYHAIPGWYENDEHLRARLCKELKIDRGEVS